MSPQAVGALALSIYMGVLTSVQVRSGLQSVRPQLRKASRSLGLTYWQELFHISGPLAFRTLLPGWIGRRPSNLSGGQQQRLAIVRALAMEPSYMLFDEVTSALDPELVGEVLDTIRKLKETGMTLVMVTHDIAFARESADRVAFFDDGNICEVGEARQVINHPQQERTQQFLQRALN